MIQLYFKGSWSNSCSEVPDGTMITVKSDTYEDKYNVLKSMGCSHGAASFAANQKWETAQEREKRMAKQSAQAPKSDKTEGQETTTTSSDNTSNECDRSGDGDDTALKAVYLEIKKPEVIKELAQIAKRREKIESDTSISATERLQETLNCIVKAYHSQNSVIVDYHAQNDLERKTISEIKQAIKQFPIPTEGDELTDFIKYVKSGAIKPKKKMKGIFDIIDIFFNGSDDDDDNYNMKNEDKIIGNLLYQKFLEIVEVRPEHPLIVPIIKKEQFKKQAKIEGIGIIIIAVLLIGWGYSLFLGLGISATGYLANEFAEVDKKYPIQIKSLKIPTHLLATIVLNIILAITIEW
ncbi:MAG: hypothetical protein IKW46_02705 [Bacteroidaceae bacterium]|nr:hypothetical protein [Bacteroidaceae bacterium]